MVEKWYISTMGLNIKNAEVEKLAAEVAQLTGETKTEAIRRSLEERRSRLETARESPEERYKRLMNWLETEVWPSIPPEMRGKPVTKEEREEILGIGPYGY